MSASSWVHVQVERIKAETQKAFLCELEDREVWVPFSQISDAENYSAGDEDVELSISAWFAEKEGLA